jgi:hypothetical protein
MRYLYHLTYEDEGEKTTLKLTEKDFRAWLDTWKDYVAPVSIYVRREAA